MTISKPELLIIADDVTGAADSAARCHHAGLTVAIDLFPTGGTPSSQLFSTTAVALSTDSRFLPPPIAAERVSAIVANFVRQFTGVEPTDQPIRWYKKIDSTLRGNIGAELAAMLPLVTPDGCIAQAIVAPAFPAQQRTLVDGYLRYAQLPPHALHLPTLLTEQCALSVTTISLATVRAGFDLLQKALLDAQAAGQTLIVVDAESEQDLECLTVATACTLPHALFCGSAGLVGVLAAQMVRQLGSPSSVESDSGQLVTDALTIAESANRHHPMLAVVGSGSSVAQQQVDYLRGISAVTVWEVDPTTPASPLAETLKESPQRTVDRSAHNAKETQTIALHLPTPAANVTLEGPLARQYAATLANAALTLIDQHRPETVVIVGGDTAVHLLQRMGIRQLRVLEELLPGMPVTVGRDSQGRAYRIILKAGNHGDVTTLATLLQL